MLWRNGVFQNHPSEKIYEEIPAPRIKEIYIEGGAFRGIAVAGLIEEFEKEGMLLRVEKLAGSSIGAIISAIIALGYSAEEAKHLFIDFDFEDLLEDGKPWPNLPALLAKLKQGLSILATEDYSLSSGENFLKWIEQIFIRKFGNANLTFAELAALVEQNPNSPYKYLSVTGSNITKNRLEIFNHITTPNMKIALALRISASFPGVFRPVRIKSTEEIIVEKKTEHGIVKEKQTREVVNVYVDGGLMNNAPVFLVKKGHEAEALLIRIDAPSEMPQVLWTSNEPNPIKGIKDFSMRLVDGMQSRDSELPLATNTIQIICDVDSLKFNISLAEKNALIEAGREAARQWLATHVSEAAEIKVFPDQRAWLAGKNIEELVQIRNRYESAKEELKNKNSSTLNITALELKIIWFDEYIHARFAQQVSNKSFSLDPVLHIDLPPLKPRHEIDEQLKRNMKKEFDEVEDELALLEEELDKHELQTSFSHLHDYFFKDIVYIAKLRERCKLLQLSRRQLLLSLNLAWPEIGNEHTRCANERNLFHFRIKDYLSKRETAYSPLINLVMVIDRQLFIEFAFYQIDENAQICLDLQQKDDFKIYILALTIYLRFSKSTDLLVRMATEVYQLLFLTSNIPTNLRELGKLLQQDNLDLAVSAYRIERLIKNFNSFNKYPLKNSSMDLDYIFKKLTPIDYTLRFSYKKTRSEIDESCEVQLDIVSKPFAFLMFQQGKSNDDDHDNANMQVDNNTNVQNNVGTENMGMLRRAILN